MALIVSALVASALGGMPRLLTAGIGIGGALLVVLVAWRRAWEVPLHAIGVTLLAVVAWWVDERTWWIAVPAVFAISASFWIAITRSRRGTLEADARSEQLASQLDRRISELFSLQELSYILSESIQLDRIVDQVARYASRFLQAEGAIVVLTQDPGNALHVVAAIGTLEPLRGRVSHDADSALVRFAIGRERIEVAQGTAALSVNLIGGTMVRSAAVAPLRSQGVTMGALAVADRQGGPFTTEDLWLLSTLATNASVVLANSRLYEMVRQSKEEWETAFNALAEGIAVVGATGLIQRANRALAEVARIPERELVGRDFCATLFGDSPTVRASIAAAHQGERPTPFTARSEESGRELRITAAPLGDHLAKGSIVVLLEDVTEQRRMEAQLIQSDKMASIGQLVSGVAHELNNPLTSIAGLTELLLERSGDQPVVPREHLRVIHDQAERAGRIVRNLLTFARKGVAEKAAVDLNEVVSGTSLLIVYELQLHRIELESRLHEEPVLVLGDRHELQQVLLNLVTNAVQAVSGLDLDRPRRIVLATAQAGDQAVLRVRDSGPGVPGHLVPRLFTPFFTTKAPGEGTGLGLSLSYGLVKAHGGVLTYTPSPEGGAEFQITLPMMYPVQEQETGGEPPPGARRVLVVDDDPAVHRVVSAVFAGEGHTVDAARTGEQGLRLAVERNYQVIVADGRLAAGTSQRFVQALLARLPEARRYLIVASPTGEIDTADVLPASVCRIRKPLNPRELRAKAVELLGTLPPA
jgi:two-component system NtrC family sensor kinase